ncbi:MAG: hypothetical protein QOJ64_588 [Acidobacteriota bacterium]|jgi:hypothetical protein|nr:hypothetical protein [Acidobacteriota bacterium]
MKRSLCLLAIIALALIGGAGKVYAVSFAQPTGVVIVEITVGKDKYFHKLKVPVVSNQRRMPDDRFDGGVFGFRESCPKDLGCEYSVIATADAIADDKSKMRVELSFKDRKSCDFDKELIVVRGKQTELKGTCRVVVRAYYDLQSSKN